MVNGILGSICKEVQWHNERYGSCLQTVLHSLRLEPRTYRLQIIRSLQLLKCRRITITFIVQLYNYYYIPEQQHFSRCSFNGDKCGKPALKYWMDNWISSAKTSIINHRRINRATFKIHVRPSGRNRVQIIWPIFFLKFGMVDLYELPITVTARSMAWTVFARSKTGIVVSNPTRRRAVCVRLFCVCVALCIGSGLATGWSPIQGILPTVYGLGNWKSGQCA
jgi:hypothetical protein